MNLAHNTTYGNPFMGNGMMGNGMMYGGNFVDVLFRHLMENGWEGLTIMALINFYMYLSLDRIKDLFKYSNDKLAEHGKKNLELFKNFTFEKSKHIFFTTIDKIKQIKFIKIKESDQIIESIKEANQITISLNPKNKTDLMALGNFLLKYKENFNLHNYMREFSDKYKTTETYILPNCITLDYNFLANYDTKLILSNTISIENDNSVDLTNKKILSPNAPIEQDSIQCFTNEKIDETNFSETKTKNEIIMRITQNVDYMLICESDAKKSIIKDVRIKIPETNIEIDWCEFRNKVKMLSCPVDSFPLFTSATANWNCNPGGFCNNKIVSIVFYIYYTKNFSLFKNLYNFLLRKENFDFGGVKYKLSNGSDYPDRLKDDSKMDTFMKELEEYCDNKLIPKYTDSKDTIDKWISNNKHMFDPVINNIPAISISFESAQISCEDLSIYSKRFFNNLILEYYHQNNDNIGDKISVYQLHITYNIETKKKENPAHIRWQEKYAKKEEKNDNDKEKDKSDDKSKTNDNDKKDDNSKNDKTNENTNKTSPDNNNSNNQMFPGMYDFPYSQHYPKFKHIPHEPNKFIEEEIYTPVAESVHIKSDKKPLQYLYLQKMTKELLTSYLSNFKNNRELYEKMGIPYKGGIILSGEPGCGKSSTIMAVATYLNKDIYYLDLGKIKTNHELKLCIDYVKTNSQKGGVIIFEDIDCMTNIVKRRNLTIASEEKSLDDQIALETSSQSITENMDTQNDIMSLSYLLNILDGTMSPENIIFIMTTNHIEILDPALIRPGRMDISINIDKCDKYQLKQIYYDLYGEHLKDSIIDKFREYEFITAEIIMHLFHNIYNKHLDQEELLGKFLYPNINVSTIIS